MTSTTRKVLSTALAATGAAGALAVAGPATPAMAQVVPCVQRIAVINNAAFNMSFTVSTRVGITSAPTDDYGINNFRLIDLVSTPLPVGDDVRPVVSAQSGGTAPAADFVSFCANGQTATYTATGTTTNFSVTLLR
jgi:hypothetical protein